MRRMRRLDIAALIFMALTVTGCNDRLRKGLGDNQQTGFGVLAPSTKIGWSLIQSKVLVTCFSCHSSTQQPLFNDSVSILSLANKIQSEVSTDQMPPPSRGYQPLNDCQKGLLSVWLSAGAPVEGTEIVGNVAACKGFISGGESPIGLMPVNYQTLLTRVLQPRCLKCHNPQDKDAGGILFYPYDVLTAAGQVERWSKPASLSKVVEMLTKTDQDRMPPPEDGAPLSVDELNFVKAWIDAGRPQ